MSDLQEAGLDKNDLPQEEFDSLLAEKVKQSKIYANAALGATGLFLEFLG